MSDMNTSTQARRNAMREAEVMARLRKSRTISTFWLCDPCTRWAALNRLEQRGAITVHMRPFPCYRVTIHRGKKAAKQEGEG
jgi:hypothetical protein